MKKSLIIAALFTAFVSCKENKEENQQETLPVAETVAPDFKDENTALVEASHEADAVQTMVSEEPKEIKVDKADEIKVEYVAFGDKFSENKALTKAQMLQKYASMKTGDTLTLQFKSKIKDVCQKKGCWMSMELPDGKESFVRFKDYGFFVPLNASEQEAVVHGKAYISEISVAQLRHYAKDGGKSDEEIEKITQPKITYAFQADGVLIRK